MNILKKQEHLITLQRTKNQQESFGELTLTEKRRSFDPFDFSNIPPMFMLDEEVPRADHPENRFYDPDPEKKVAAGIDDDDEPNEEEEFASGIEDRDLDLTGRNMSFTSFKKVQQYILDAYDLLRDPKDKKIFVDYLITNMKLYLDKFEDELQAAVEEPTTPEYEQAKGI